MNNPDFEINLTNSSVENEKSYFEIELNGGARGVKGDTGANGQDGYSPTVTTSKSGKTTTITITDVNGTHVAEIQDGEDGSSSGDMLKSVYDTNNNGIVDNAEKVNNHTVEKDVPSNAIFTDTTYSAGTGISINNNTISNTITKTSDISNDSGFITKEVNNLTNYTLKTSTGSLIDLEVNSSTYVVTLTLKDVDGNTISTDSIDLPLESVVVSGSFDSVNKKIVLTLQNGNTIDIPVGDLVAGLQTEITSSNKIASDYVDDSNSGNKFVSTSEKITWNNKYEKPSGGIPSTDMSSAVQTSLSKADTAIQDVSGKLDVSKVKTSASTTSGDVYDVIYINSLVGDINTALDTINGEVI